MTPGPLGPGASIGPYMVVGELARGGMGIVFRARRGHDGALLALKVMRTDGARPDQVLRFQREAELAARLSHPGIVRIHDAGAGPGGLQFIAMDLVDGAPLSERVGRLAPLEAVRIVAEVARAVEHAHAHGVIHRDLKPSNVLLRRDDGRAVVTDFGVAREVQHGASLTRTGAMVGTPTYLAPEQVDGSPATTAIDVHALGVLLFETLTGSPPYAQENLQTLLVAISDRRPVAPGTIVPGVPRAVDRLVLAALQKAPARRPTAAAFAGELEAVLASGGAEPPRRRAAVLAAAGVAIVVAVAGLAWSTRAEPPSVAVPPPPPVAPATPVTPVAPPSEVPWERPAWLGAVETEGDTRSLVAALDALEGDVDVHPRTRARALEALAALDARWVEPNGFGVDTVAALDRLAFLHALWKRLDPAHAVPAARRASFERLIGMTMGSHRDRSVVESVARAVVEVLPDNLEGHVLYAQVTGDPDRRHLQTGLDLAARAGDDATWAVMLSLLTRALWSAALGHGADGQPDPAAAAALVSLALQVSPLETRGPKAVATTFLRAADVTNGAASFSLLGRAVRLVGETPDTWATRARWQRRTGAARRDPALAAEALASLDRARALERVRDAADHPMVAEIASLRADLHEAAGRPEDALAALDEGLARSSESLQAGLVLRRALALARAPGVDLAPVLHGLTARLEAREREVQFQRRTVRVVSKVQTALARVRALSAADTDAVVPALEALAGDAALLRALNPP